MTSAERTLSELAMLVRMLVSALKQYDAAHPIAAKATRLLADRGLLGTGLRQEDDYGQLDAQTFARSADHAALRLDATDMAPLRGGFRMGRSGQLIAGDGGPVIALDGGPGRGLVGPQWQFEPLMQEALPRLSAALGMSDGWTLLAFLESPHGALGGRTPRQAIEQGEVDLVIEVAAHH